MVALLTSLSIIFLAAAEDYPIDITGAANANPLSEDDLHEPGVDIPETSYMWFEGEHADATSRDFEPVEGERASNGKMLSAEFGLQKGDWAEWYFNYPWQCPEANLYIRTTRVGVNAFTELEVTLNGEKVGATYVPVNEGVGHHHEDFLRGTCVVQFDGMPMGRQALRLTATAGGEEIYIDGFWLACGRLDLVNRVGENGMIRPPAVSSMLLYRPGMQILGGVRFFLIDPFELEQAVIDFTEGDVVLPGDGFKAKELFVVGAGLRGPQSLDVTIEYSNGAKEERSLSFGPLYREKAGEAAMELGEYRYGYVAGTDITVDRVETIRLSKPSGRIVILAATLRR